jgi:hypothetical protein
MKNDSSITFLPKFSSILLLFVALAGAAVPLRAQASPELDRQYSLSTIGILRAWDNVDGLFGDLVTKTYEEHLAGNSRFVVNNLAKANATLQSSKLPYAKAIEDPEVLGQISKALRIDTFLRTKVYKEGPKYRFTVDWIHAPKLQLIASDSFQVEQPFRGEGKLGTAEFRTALTNSLDRLIAKIPFKGSVTGRDQTSLTVNLGTSSGVAKGDTLVLATVDEVKFHPLLKTIVDWRLTSTGKATVDEVEEGMAFARIEAEEYGRQIQRFQKVVQIIPARENPEIENRVLDREEMEKKAAEPPRLGWIAPGMLLGNVSRDTGTETGSGFLYGFKAEAQAWFTSDFFGEFRYAYGAAGYTQKTAATQASTLNGVSLSMSQMRLAFGYFYHVTPNFFGPKGWVKAGYQGTSYNLPENTTAQTSNVSFSGLLIGVGGELPIRQDYGVILDVDFGMFGSGTETSSFFGTASGATSVNFFAGGYYWFEPKLRLQLGLDFKSHSLDFVSGASVSYKSFAIAPSLLFYF